MIKGWLVDKGGLNTKRGVKNSNESQFVQQQDVRYEHRNSALWQNNPLSV